MSLNFYGRNELFEGDMNLGCFWWDLTYLFGKEEILFIFQGISRAGTRGRKPQLRCGFVTTSRDSLLQGDGEFSFRNIRYRLRLRRSLNLRFPAASAENPKNPIFWIFRAGEHHSSNS